MPLTNDFIVSQLPRTGDQQGQRIRSAQIFHRTVGDLRFETQLQLQGGERRAFRCFRRSTFRRPLVVALVGRRQTRATRRRRFNRGQCAR